MGRKAKFDETKKVKKGPGRKARKQPDPVFKKGLRKLYFILQKVRRFEKYLLYLNVSSVIFTLKNIS